MPESSAIAGSPATRRRMARLDERVRDEAVAVLDRRHDAEVGLRHDLEIVAREDRAHLA